MTKQAVRMAWKRSTYKRQEFEKRRVEVRRKYTVRRSEIVAKLLRGEFIFYGITASWMIPGRGMEHRYIRKGTIQKMLNLGLLERFEPHAAPVRNGIYYRFPPGKPWCCEA